MYHADNTAKAELHFSMAIRFASEYAPAYLHMGNLLIRAGRYAEAIGYFSTGLTKSGDLKGPMLEGIAQAYELQGKYREAIRAYRKAATASVVDFEVDRLLNGVKRCRKKRISNLLSF